MKEISDELKGIDKVKGESKPLKFGFPDLENTLRVHREGGQLIILASRPAMGKSSLALNMASYFAENEGMPVAFFSLEMLGKEVTLRLLAQRGNVEANSIRDSKLLDGDLIKIGKCISDLSKLPIFINDDGDIELDELKVSALEVKNQHGLGLIVIDYLQLLNSTERNLTREQQISEMMRGLKSLAKELEVPIIVLSQLSKGVEAREDKRPQLSDLRESSSIASEADIVMFLYRDSYYNSDCIYPNKAEVIIAKNRSGETGTINLEWNSKYTSFKSSENVKNEVIEDSIVNNHNFGNLEVGEFNKSSVLIAKELSRNPDDYSAVFINSAIGGGKSHTLHAIYNELKENFPEKSVYLTSASKLTADLLSAIQDRSLSEFNNKIMGIDILLIDDIDYIADKNGTQMVLANIFNDMKNLKKLIIVTGNQSLRKMSGINESLSSRMSESLIISIDAPELEFKKMFFKKSCLANGIDLTESAVSELPIADLSIREIIAISEKLSVLKTINENLKDEDVKEALKHMIKDLIE